MPQAIVPLSDVEPEALKTFLRTLEFSDAVIEWKYFDNAFNRTGVRGFCAVRDDREVVGLIGLIPFRVVIGAQQFDAAWTCDWYVDNRRASGVAGIELLKRAVFAFPSLYHVGGNEITRRLLPRLATFADLGGAVDYRLFLRAGELVKRAKARMPPLRFVPSRFLSEIPVRRLRKPPINIHTTIESGVARSIEKTMPATQFESDYYPAYTADYVRWQIGSCPTLVSFTCTAPSGALALTWHSIERPTEWRMAIRLTTAGLGEHTAVVTHAVRHAYEQGASIITIRVSERDRSLRQLIEQLGFKAFDRAPFWAFHSNFEDVPKVCMTGLSYLDADNAYIIE